MCRCRGASSPDSFSFPTAPVGSVSQPPRSSNQHSGSTQPSSVSSPSPSTAASTRSTGVATSGVERDRNRGRDREKRRPPERRSSRRQHHSNYVPPPPPPPPAEDDIAETNLPSPPASPSPAAVQKQEDMEAKLKARQAERLQAERMAAMRATQKEREVRAAEAEIEQRCAPSRIAPVPPVLFSLMKQRCNVRCEHAACWYGCLHYDFVRHAVIRLRSLTGARVSLWAGKKDLRSLLASLPSIWNAASVSTFPASLYSESGDSKVKKAYMQALRLVHPDKLPANTVRCLSCFSTQPRPRGGCTETAVLALSVSSSVFVLTATLLPTTSRRSLLFRCHVRVCVLASCRRSRMKCRQPKFLHDSKLPTRFLRMLQLAPGDVSLRV